MAARWMEAKLAKMREARSRNPRPMAMPEGKAVEVGDTSGVKVKRIACKGTVPQGGYRQGACRKAHGGPVELWTGSPRSNGRMPNATGVGMYRTNSVYEPNAVWAIVKR